MPMTDETVNKIMWSIPNVLCLVGSRSGEEWNGMTTSWVTQVAMEPVLIAISVDANAVTNRLIAESGVFTVNLWDREDTRVFVKFSKPAERDGNTLNGRPVHIGESGAPIFDEAIAYIDCRVWSTLDCGSHSIFVGEIVDCGFHDGGEEKAVARIEDTRMKYGGVLREGHKRQ